MLVRDLVKVWQELHYSDSCCLRIVSIYDEFKLTTLYRCTCDSSEFLDFVIEDIYVVDSYDKTLMAHIKDDDLFLERASEKMGKQLFTTESLLEGKIKR